jgi:fatty acid kinase
MGGISAVEVADMHEQIAERSERLDERPALQLLDGGADRRRTDVVFVTVGDGNAAIARGAGARGLVAGGQSMNPSTEDILHAIEAADADEVVVLPNNRNVVLAAAEAVRAAPKPAALVETASIPQGLAALLAYEPGAGADANAEAMTAAAAAVRFAEVTRAVRAATVDGVAVRDGDYLGLVDGRIVLADASLERAVAGVAARLVEDGREFVTALTGAVPDDAERARQALEAFFDEHDGVELEVHDGGQPHYPLLLSAE